jgi:hypothetical protein
MARKGNRNLVAVEEKFGKNSGLEIKDLEDILQLISFII